MAKVLINDSTLSNIADAIRNKTSKTDKMKPGQMADEIANIETGGDTLAAFLDSVTPGTITTNATTIPAYQFYSATKYQKRTFAFNFPKLTMVETCGFCGYGTGTARNTIDELTAPELTTIKYCGFQYVQINKIDAPKIETLDKYSFYRSEINTDVFNLSNVKSYGMYALGYTSGFKTALISTAADDVATVNLASYLMVGNTTVERVELKAPSIEDNSFNGCTNLTALILRRTDAITKLEASGALKNTAIANGTGYIYVPDDLLEQYETATNWALYADQLKTISELEETTND